MSNSSVFKVRLKVLRSSADQQLYNRASQLKELNAFADNANVILGTKINSHLNVKPRLQHVAVNMLLVDVNKIVASYVARLLQDTNGYKSTVT